MKLNRNGTIHAEDGKHTGEEPKWGDAKTITLAEYKERAYRAVQFYTYYCTQKDCQDFVVEYMKQHGGFDKDSIALIKKYGQTVVSSSIGKLCRALTMGMPKAVDGFGDYYEKVMTTLNNEAIPAAKELKGEDKAKVESDLPKKDKPKVSPMVLLEEKVGEKIISELNDLVDAWEELKTGIPNADLTNLLIKHDIPANGCKFIRTYLKKNLKEYKEVQKGRDEELVDAYSHLGGWTLKALIRNFEAMLAQLDKYELDKKVVRKRSVKKGVSAIKQVAKVNYLVESKKFCVKSLDPSSVPSSTICYIFNENERKLSRVASANRQGLSIKGTTINGFDPDDSYIVTLRKPQDILNLFKKNKPLAAIEKEISKIKTKRLPATGRINKHCVILHVNS